MELILILAVLAILAALQLPSFQEPIRKARRAEGRSALLQQMQQQERYYAQHTTYVSFSSSSPNGFKWYSGDTPASSWYEISAAPCKDDVIQNCVVLTAEPGTAKVNRSYVDHACKNLILTSAGTQTSTGSATGCW